MISKAPIANVRHLTAAEFKPSRIQGDDLSTARIVFVTPEGQETIMRATPTVWAVVRGQSMGHTRHSGFDRITNTDFLVCTKPPAQGDPISGDITVAVHRIARQGYDPHSGIPVEVKDLKDVTIQIDSATGEMHVQSYPPNMRPSALRALLIWLEPLDVIKPGASGASGSNSMRVLSVSGDIVHVTVISHASTAPTTLSAAMDERAGIAQAEEAGARA